jgi:hypothetical protein
MDCCILHDIDDKSSNFGFDLKGDTITIYGDGANPVSQTGTNDLARFVAHVLTTLLREQIEGTRFRIEGDRIVSQLPMTIPRYAYESHR